MNLVSIMDLYAGGPGSGCEGPNCGRRPSSVAKVVAVDFDNTIAEHKTGSGVLGEPKPNGLALMNALREKGYEVIIFTARPDVTKVQAWLEDHGVGWARATNNKPNAAAYVDDRAVHWTGDDSLEDGLSAIDKMSQIKDAQEREGKRARGLNIQSSILIYAGGPGSGCNPQAGRCGRWPGQGQTQQFYQDKFGHYVPERLVEHDKAIKKYQTRPPQEGPRLKLIAGGTASGKTSASKREFADLRDPAIVNMDMPRADLPEFNQVAGTHGTGLLQEEASDIRDKILMSAAGHNNDIALDAVGSPGLAKKLDGLEQAGYKMSIAYVHSPVEESLAMADRRTKNAEAQGKRADMRKIPEEVTRASHEKSRGSLPLLMKPGREVKIYDRTGKAAGEPYDLIYHRTEDGTVKVRNDAQLERMRHAKGETEIPDIF